MLRQARDGSGCDAARGEVWSANSCRGCGKNLEGFALPMWQRLRGGERGNSGPRDRRHPRRLVRVRAAAARHRRQQRRNRVADARGVVLRGPARERDDIGRDEGPRVQYLPNRLQHDRRFAALAARLDDDARDDARAERDDDARADRGRRHAVGHGICEEIEIRDRNGDEDEQLPARFSLP
jgi:hypothetical protein